MFVLSLSEDLLSSLSTIYCLQSSSLFLSNSVTDYPSPQLLFECTNVKFTVNTSFYYVTSTSKSLGLRCGWICDRQTTVLQIVCISSVCRNPNNWAFFCFLSYTDSVFSVICIMWLMSSTTKTSPRRYLDIPKCTWHTPVAWDILSIQTSTLWYCRTSQVYSPKWREPTHPTILSILWYLGHSK